MTATVTIKIEAPDDCTKQQVIEWIETRLGVRQKINPGNPLKDVHLGAERIEALKLN